MGSGAAGQQEGFGDRQPADTPRNPFLFDGLRPGPEVAQGVQQIGFPANNEICLLTMCASRPARQHFVYSPGVKSNL